MLDGPSSLSCRALELPEQPCVCVAPRDPAVAPLVPVLTTVSAKYMVSNNNTPALALARGGLFAEPNQQPPRPPIRNGATYAALQCEAWLWRTGARSRGLQVLKMCAGFGRAVVLADLRWLVTWFAWSDEGMESPHGQFHASNTCNTPAL